MACGFKLSYFTFLTLSVWELHIFLVFGEEQVPCYFVFGDSLVDNGNNNQLITQAKANYPPYGIDFQDGQHNGRFTNGENIPDVLAGFLGFKDYIPSFATARGNDILNGVNYGSGGAGIRAETGLNLGGRISLSVQLLNHKITIGHIAFLQRNKTLTNEFLRKCIYTVGMGSNDYINNYFMPDNYATSRIYTPDQYASVLIQQYSKQLMTLYRYGARKVAIFGIGQVGCIPAAAKMFATNGSSCVEILNTAAQLFDNRLKPLVDQFNNDLRDAKFIYVNMTSISSGDPSSIGITVLNAPCCVVSTNIAEGQCAPNQIPCSNRNAHIFWDDFHPTEIANVIIATRSYTAFSPFDAYPFDISTLAKLQ